MDTVSLSRIITETDEDATAKCKLIQDENIVALIGCTGSGKTTVSLYVQGSEFECERGKLRQKEPSEGAEIGDQRQSATRGLAVGSQPIGDGLLLADLAGTGDTAGSVAELCGAVYHSSVLQAARSVRIALVMGRDRAAMSNERGKGIVRDLDHVAGLFKHMNASLRSVGLIVTSGPDILVQSSPAASILQTVTDALEELESTAKPVAGTSWEDLREFESGQPTGMEMTPDGRDLLVHLQRQCQRACTMVDEVKEGVDYELVDCLAKNSCAVFPVNVLRGDQRDCLSRFLSNLEPVKNPAASMAYRLPSECRNDLAQALDTEVARVRRQLDIKGADWAADPKLVEAVLNLLQLLTVMDSKQLCQWAHSMEQDLCEQLVCRNKRACAGLLEGVALGNLSKVENSLQALADMDSFRTNLNTRLPSLTLQGWSSLRSAMKEGIESLKNESARLLPEDISEVKWDEALTNRVFAVLKAARKLDSFGSEFLGGWAERLAKHVLALKSSAAACADVVSVVRALAQLEAYQKFLPQVMKFLRDSGCELPFGGDLAVVLEEAKVATRATLAEMSRSMVEAQRASGSSAGQEALALFCRSTELNDMLGEDLVDVFQMKPLSSVLLPTQEEIDGIAAMMLDSSDQWCIYLECLAQRVQDAGELGPKMIAVAGLDFGTLLDTIMQRVDRESTTLQNTLHQLTESGSQPSGSQLRSSYAAASVCSGDRGRFDVLDCELPEEPAEVEEAEEALVRLKDLLPADSLLVLFGRVELRTALMSLNHFAWALNRTLTSLLKKAKRELMSWSCATTLDSRALLAMAKLAACLRLSKPASDGLALQTHRKTEGTRATLERVTKEASLFLQDFVRKELGEWARAEAGKKGWLPVFYRHVQQSKRLKIIAAEEVWPAYRSLVQKVLEWRDGCLAKAREASEKDEAWWDFIDYAVCQGLCFEESPLPAAMELEGEDFRDLVEQQALLWQRTVEGAQTTGQRLRELAVALERLPGYMRDTRTMQLRKGLDQPLERLDAALCESERYFQKALEEERYPEACKWLLEIRDSKRNGELLAEKLKQTVEKTLEHLGASADGEDVVRAGKKARSLEQSCEEVKLEDEELASKLRAQLAVLKQELRVRREEAATHLQWALDGRGSPARALLVLAALGGKSRVETAEEGLHTFIQAKKKELPKMSCEDLLTWITRQDTLLRSTSMPEELKGNSATYDGLIKTFVQHFVKAFRRDLDELDRSKDAKDWGQVKQASEKLHDIIESAFELDILRPEKTPLKTLRRRLGFGNDGALGQAKEEVKRGNFYLAIRALVTGDSKAEMELCAVINEELAKNMKLQGVEEASLQTRVSVLESFLTEVGSNPPDELKNLSREVRGVHERLRPQLASAANAAVEASMTAASGRETELLRMARALAYVKNFEDALSNEKQRELKEKLGEFFKRVKRVVAKLACDVQALRLSSLNLSLEPVRLWLQDFAQLSHEEKKELMKALESRSDDLKDWLRHELAKPLEELVDCRAVQNEAQSMSFNVVSQRCEVANKLNALLQTPCVDLSLLGELMLQHKDAGLTAIKSGSLVDFNPHYKVLKSASADLQELTLANSCLGELQNALQGVLEPLGQRIRSAGQVDAAVASIIELRSLANDAPDAYDDVLSRLRSGLAHMPRKSAGSAQAINTVGARLGQSGIGQLVLAEFPEVFGAAKDMQNNTVFRRAGETGDARVVVGRLTQNSGLGGQEYHELEKALLCHEEKSRQLQERYLLESQSFDEAKTKAKQDLDAAVGSASAAHPAESKAETGRALLTHLAVCFSVIKCGREFMEAPLEEKNNCLVAPHRAQMLSIFRLLHAHKTGSVPWVSWLFGARADPSRGARFENHLAEVLTGEGKCLTLGLLATFLALQGIESDVVCYREILTVQDWQAMLPFYKFVGVQDQIRYVTFDQLCAERLVAIKQASEQLLRAESLGGQIGQRPNVSRRALLIDEVDVFFGRRFYGETWDGGFKLRSPAAVELVRFMFEEKRGGRQVTAMQIARIPAFWKLVAEVPAEMQDAMRVAAVALAKNLEDWSKPEPVVDAVNGRIGYRDKDEIDYDLSFANKTVFAYLNCEMEGQLKPKQVEEHVGIDLFCGRFSFAELPNQYCCILGVTGTLGELLKTRGVRALLEKEYRFKHYTYTPSIFGERRLVFRPAEHVAVLENEPDWLSRIEGEVADQRKSGNAVLVFFKNETSLRKFPNWSSYETLTERTDQQRRNGYIAAATTAGRVTLLTRAFGRGIDFQMPAEGHEVVVLQTFLSSLISEETQIKGRTARQGKSGQYRLVLCAEHLEAKMGFRPEEVQMVRRGGGEEIEKLLQRKQAEKTLSKMAGLNQRKERAAQLERDTEAWEQLLFDPGASASAKLRRLAEWNAGEHGFAHYTVLLDNSSSMSGRPWRELTTAFQGFRAELLRHPATAAATLVSVSVFNTVAHTVTPSHVLPAEVQDIGHIQAGGGTDFEAAFAEARRLIGRSPPGTKEVILFLTDGEAPVPAQQINALLAEHRERINSLTCVAFGQQASSATTKRIGELFRQAGVQANLRASNDKDSLVQTFVEVAGSRPIHFGDQRATATASRWRN